MTQTPSPRRNLTVALTGATGYIASHVAVALHEAGHRVVGFDNFANSSPVVLERLAELMGEPMPFADMALDQNEQIAAFFAEHRVDTVVHLAGYKAVGESVASPDTYYCNNVGGTISLLEAMAASGVSEIVFSSSATVYSPAAPVPLVESAPLGPVNPYGQTKAMIEQMLVDLAAADKLRAISLRYFNPVGAHPSGRIGEDPVGVPNNLMPFAMQVAVGRRDEMLIFGDDYDTPDGTGVRDYIHVCDLARGHVAAVEAMGKVESSIAINLGTGAGSSVKEVLAAARAASGTEIPARVVDRRDGDLAVSFADPGLARDFLAWQAKLGLGEACEDHWRWQSHNPTGYSDS